MRNCVNNTLAIFLTGVLGCLLAAAPVAAAEYAFELTLDPAVRAEPFTGRVYLFFAQGDREPRFGPNWFNPGPMLAVDVRDWKPGEPLSINTTDESRLIVFPKALRDQDLSGLNVQAVARFNPLVREVGAGTGNGFSAVAKVEGADGKPAGAKLAIDKVVEERKFPENEWCRLLDLRSELLSKFHGRDVHQRASVVLPASYHKEPDRRYPVIFVVQVVRGAVPQVVAGEHFHLLVEFLLAVGVDVVVSGKAADVAVEPGIDVIQFVHHGDQLLDIRLLLEPGQIEGEDVEQFHSPQETALDRPLASPAGGDQGSVLEPQRCELRLQSVIDTQPGLGKRNRDMLHPDVLELGDALRDVDTQAAHRGGKIETG